MPLRLCGWECVNTDNDPRHCDGCGRGCAVGQACSAGVCTLRCATGFADCDGNASNGCEASLNASTSCGSCGRACSLGQLCVNGTCVTSMDCPTGQTRCDGVCVDHLDNTNHCGRCGNVCLGGARCTNGVCGTSPGGTILLSGLGGRAGFGTLCLAPYDDGSWPMPIPLGPTFPSGINYYGRIFTSFYVNNNGNISFQGPLGTHNPVAIPQTNGAPMIAPWWADVDTRGGDPPTTNNICFHTDSQRTAVTWHLVGYFSSHHNLLNSFQVLLTPLGGTDFTVELRYDRCRWTTGDASGGTNGLGGTPAQAGFEGGMGRGFVLPGSGTSAVLNLCSTSNVGQPGVWRYTFREGLPVM